MASSPNLPTLRGPRLTSVPRMPVGTYKPHTRRCDNCSFCKITLGNMVMAFDNTKDPKRNENLIYRDIKHKGIGGVRCTKGQWKRPIIMSRLRVSGMQRSASKCRFYDYMGD